MTQFLQRLLLLLFSYTCASGNAVFASFPKPPSTSFLENDHHLNSKDRNKIANNQRNYRLSIGCEIISSSCMLVSKEVSWYNTLGERICKNQRIIGISRKAAVGNRGFVGWRFSFAASTFTTTYIVWKRESRN